MARAHRCGWTTSYAGAPGCAVRCPASARRCAPPTPSTDGDGRSQRRPRMPGVPSVTASPADGTPSRLLLLDGHSLAYRAFFALPVENFATTTGQPTNAVYGFTSMLINILRDEQPTHVGVAFDVSRVTFRSEEYSDYKANRSKSPDEF